jgi:predicted permease
MIDIVGALVPVFVMIALGVVLTRVGFPGAAFWPSLERLVYLVLFPALLVHDLALADLGGLRFGGLLGASLTAIVAMVAVSLVLAKAMRLDGPGFTSLFQGMTRCNGFVALASAKALHGAPGVSMMALVITCMVPAVNLVSVVLLARFGSGRGGVLATLRDIVTNPLILACLGGIALNVTGIGLHPLAARTLEALGQAALPLGLMAVGAGLDLGRAMNAGGAVAVGVAGKCLLFPALVWGIAELFGLGGLARATLVLFATMPTAPSAFILARQLGGDAALVGAITTLATLAAAGTVPLMLSWLR